MQKEKKALKELYCENRKKKKRNLFSHKLVLWLGTGFIETHVWKGVIRTVVTWL